MFKYRSYPVTVYLITTKLCTSKPVFIHQLRLSMTFYTNRLNLPRFNIIYKASSSIGKLFSNKWGGFNKFNVLLDAFLKSKKSVKTQNQVFRRKHYLLFISRKCNVFDLIVRMRCAPFQFLIDLFVAEKFG